MTSSRSARRRRRADRRRALRADGKPPSDLRLECELPVEFVAAGEDDGQPKVRRFKMTAYSGGTMRPRGFFRDAVLDLTGVKVLGGNRPVLLGHDHSKIVGHTEQVEVNKRITAEGLVSGAGEAAREVTASADNGFPWRASVGGDIQETEFVAEGQTVLVNGRRFRGPLTVIRKATIAEISFVPIAGDDRTNAKIAASRNRGDVSVDFQKWLEARGLSEEQLSEEQLKQFRADWQAEKRRLEARRSLADELDRLIADRTTDDLSREEVLDQIVASAGLSGETLEQLLEASIDLPSEVSRKDLLEAAKNDDTPRSRPAPARPEEDYRRRIAAEDRRIEAVRALCARYGDPQIPLEGSGEQVNLRAHAIEHNWSLEKVELHAMRYTRPRVPAGHSADHTPRAGVLEAALCLSAGMPEKIVAQGLSEQEVDRATSREARSNATLHALMDTVILAAGGYYTGNRKSNDFIRAAMRAEKQLMAGRSYSSLQASNGFSTISLSGILGNTANKAMLAAYEAVETVHQLITAPRNQSDFKVWTRYRLDSTGAFKKVGADGELKHVGLDEGSYTNQLDTYGAIIALTCGSRRPCSCCCSPIRAASSRRTIATTLTGRTAPCRSLR
jgi:hypothetical protein